MGKKEKKHEDKDVLIPEKAELVSPFEEMERWFGDFMSRPFFSPMWVPRFHLSQMQSLSPSIDVYEESDTVVVKAELPGIGKEDVDVDIVATALREAEEEVNIKPSDVRVIGQLTELYISPSNFLVHPILGILDKPPLLIPDQHEVQSIHLPELQYLLRDDIISEKDIVLSSGYKLRTPYFEVDGHVVWGATAMIIAELKDLLKDIDLNS